MQLDKFPSLFFRSEKQIGQSVSPFSNSSIVGGGDGDGGVLVSEVVVIVKELNFSINFLSTEVLVAFVHIVSIYSFGKGSRQPVL